jgi:hypothetical protein
MPCCAARHHPHQHRHCQGRWQPLPLHLRRQEEPPRERPALWQEERDLLERRMQRLEQELLELRRTAPRP